MNEMLFNYTLIDLNGYVALGTFATEKALIEYIEEKYKTWREYDALVVIRSSWTPGWATDEIKITTLRVLETTVPSLR